MLLLVATSLARPQTTTSAPRSLREMLTAEEFHRAGLDKLTPEELSFLSARMLGSSAQPPSSHTDQPAPAEASRPVAASPAPEKRPMEGAAAFGQEQKLRDEVESNHRIPNAMVTRIQGVFRGWSGHTIFELENGQVWQQTEDAVFSIRVQNPTVKIEKGSLGTYFLGVEGYGSRVKVRRMR